ncbi:hypothetical protein JCM33374_g6432 [Metschnikowia sp. JCM 33374]|nr:hypothetical protein JCM33374_g6432 [Metschnikowia sp. JCM 33374]
MRHRISYVHAQKHEKPIRAVNASYVEVDPGVSVAREDKYTLDVDRLTHVSALRIHIENGGNRYQSEGGAANSENSENSENFENSENSKKSEKSANGVFENTSPFSYNYQAGVHVYAVPSTNTRIEDKDVFYAQVNSVLSQVLNITVAPEQWVRSLNSFYFHTSEALEANLAAIPRLCESSPSVQLQFDALDYYYSDAKLSLTTLDRASRDLSVKAAGSEAYTEVGIFHIMPQSSRDDLMLSGARVIMNEETDDRHGQLEETTTEEDASAASRSVHKTMFHIKPRHRHLDSRSSFSVRANGLHPVITVGNIPPPPSDDDVANCKAFTYLTLEKSVFLDPYQVPDVLEIVTNFGPTNLELPEYSVPEWGNEILMEVAENTSGPVELTLHSRYQLPDAAHTHTQVRMDHPVLFYACDVTSDGFLLKNSPFDTKKPIGGSFEKFFTEDTVFYHFSDRGSSEVSVPNASGDANTVNLVTLVSLLVGVLMILFKVYKRIVSGPTAVSSAKKSD